MSFAPSHSFITQLPSIMLFDWDETLVRSWPYVWELYKMSFASQGEDILDYMTKEACHASCVRHGKNLFEEILGEEKGVLARQFFLKRYAPSDDAPSPDPFEDAEKVLSFFKRAGVACGIVSNKSTERILWEVERLGWSTYFKSVVGKDVCGTKPSPFSLLRAVQEIAPTCSPSLDRVWFMGDSVVDAQTALAAACQFVAFGEVSNHYQSLPHVPYTERPPYTESARDEDLTYRSELWSVANWNQFLEILVAIKKGTSVFTPKHAT